MSTAVGARRRLFVASGIGALAALAVMTVVIADGHADLLVREPFGNFFDAQARSLLHGHWDVPANEMFIEGFSRGGKTYQYFGVWPALLRMPLLAVSESMYGRLTQLSMLLAAALTLAGFTALHWRIREVLRPGRACSTGEALVVGAATFAFGCGTTLVFLTSRAWVYHEAIVWGVAWTLIAFEQLIAYVNAPSGRTLALASGATTLAFASRGSMGIGPAVALGLVLAGQLLLLARGRWAALGGDSPGGHLTAHLTWLGPAVPARDARAGLRRVLGLGLALAVPVALYAAVNDARFGSLLSVPWSHQLLMNVDPRHRQVIDANHGSYFGLGFGPTTLLQYLRPDALAPSHLFPWITFPRFRTPVIGNVLFDTLDPSSSVPASMPAVALLGVVGVVAVLRTSVAGTRAAATLRVALVGAAASCALVIFISYVAQRYLGDFLPVLAVAALIGLQVLLARRAAPRAAPVRRWANGLLVAVAVLTVFGVWANLSLTLLYQRLYNPADPGSRAGMLAFQYDIDGHLPGHPHQVVRAAQLPPTVAAAGTTVVVGDCAATYWSDGRSWIPVEGSPAGGWYHFRAVFPAGADLAWEPVLSWSAPAGPRVLGARRVGPRVEVGLGRPDASGALVWQSGTAAAPGRAVELAVVLDRGLEHIEVRVGGIAALDLSGAPDLPGGPVAVGRAAVPGVAPRFRVSLRARQPALAVCRALGDLGPARSRAGAATAPDQPAGIGASS